MKVLHVLAPAQFGGLERVVNSLATAQHRRGSSVSAAIMIGLGQPEPDLGGALRAAGVPVLPIAAPSRGYRSQVASIRDIVNRGGFDVVHSHGYVADVLSAIALRKRQSALVSTVHGFTGGNRKNQFYEWLDVRALGTMDRVVAVSKKLSVDLETRGLARQLIETVVNAWEPSLAVSDARSKARQVLRVSDDTFVVGWVGRMTREKGLDVFVDALQSLQDLQVRFAIIGDGRERAALQETVRRGGCADRVTWTGAVSDAASLLPALDVLVMSSRTEGTPMVLLEAMDALVPIVSTAVGGIPDVIGPSDGVLVKSEDPAALAAAIRDVVADPRAARARAAAAKLKLRQSFAIEPWLDRYEAVYRTALSRT